ncbi:poly(A) RNA polymerase GLD2-A-like isoform X1 [Stegodyphus dumicola]|uniref:poly(A) RNA polymerase GLD2-A-like isoform X1 n=1 Tax=Stegodyphus dumicola TaxID=202533 RepID=UPI0015AD599F|nr:poly(A) RNA polymerase GLD2-A-like isoform X1 [Stegodyphus dumicola]XP_035217147.1 poly(A) RNA polymerase GLD2-A-like isoform X1 [Stegodyphus dumicola]
MEPTVATPRKFHVNRCIDNSPVFFTGLTKTLEQKVTLLCVKCNRINNNVDGKDTCSTCSSSVPVTQNGDHFEQSSNEVCSLTISGPSLSEQVFHIGPKIENTRRKALLPLPESIPDPSCLTNDKTSPDKPPKNNHEFKNNMDSSLKRKGDYESPTKKFRSSFCSPSTPISNRNIELSRRIWQLFMENKQTDIVFQKKMTLRDKLHEILIKRFPSCGLYVVGSSMTGLGANSSDMDMCLMLTDSEIDQEKEAKDILHIVHSLFERYDFLFDIEVIYAKVPILRFKDAVSGIEVDLNVNNAVGIRNTQLLASYARMDKRLAPLVLLVKKWARYHGINDAKHNTLSSYSLVLMIIHYLQYGCYPPVLPCLQRLQPDKFHAESDVRTLKRFEDLPNFESENVENLGDLFIGFLKYFAVEFNYYKNVMSVRLGSVIPKEIAMMNPSPRNKKAHWKLLCIEEPFDLTNTARAVFISEAFHHVRQVFINSWNCIKNNPDLDSILN